MPTSDPRETLWKNLVALMDARWGGVNKRALAQKAGIGEATVYLISSGDNWISLSVLQKVAAVFKLPAWRLLKPNVLTANEHTISEVAVEIGEMFDKLPEARQLRAYALIVQLLEFSNETHVDGPPSEPPTPGPSRTRGTPPAPRPAEPAPKRALGKRPKPNKVG